MRRPSTDNTSGISIFFDMMINSNMSKVECCENYSMGGCFVKANLHDVGSSELCWVDRIRSSLSLQRICNKNWQSRWSWLMRVAWCCWCVSSLRLHPEQRMVLCTNLAEEQPTAGLESLREAAGWDIPDCKHWPLQRTSRGSFQAEATDLNRHFFEVFWCHEPKRTLCLVISWFNKNQKCKVWKLPRTVQVSHRISQQ